MLNPIPFTLNLTQTRVSLLICDALPTFPKVQADLVASYCSYENMIPLAQNPTALKVGIVDPALTASYGCDMARLINSPENLEYSAAVRYCLSCSDCSPHVRQTIIRRLLNYDHAKFWSKQPDLNARFRNPFRSSFGLLVLNALLDAMRAESISIDFSDVDLTDMNLRGLNLSHARAVGTKFAASQLDGAVFCHADLSGSDFCRVNLRDADLEGAVLRNANLQEACFAGARLRFVDVTGARFGDTVLSTFETDRTDVTGLITSDQSLNKFLGRFKKYFSNDVIISGKVRLSSYRKERNKAACVIS